ncbi:MAG: type II secretion system protein GspG, partial [Planctomycetota bacterium]
GLFMLTQPEVIEVTTDMFNLAIGIQYYERQQQALPEDLDDLGLGVATLTDPWGNRYRYVLASSDPGFDVWSSGQDGEFETADDLALSRLGEVWEHAFETFELKMEELGHKLESLNEGGKSPFPFCTEESKSAYKRYYESASGVCLPLTHD